MTEGDGPGSHDAGGGWPGWPGLAEIAGWTLLSMSAVVVVLERAGPAAALRRSWQLARTRFWRILGILLLTALIYFVVSEIIALPFIGPAPRR